MGTLFPTPSHELRGVAPAVPIAEPAVAPWSGSADAPLSVAQVTKWIQGFVRQNAREVVVVGEVANSGKGWGGKLFSLTLKDPTAGVKAQIDVVAFVAELSSDWMPEDGVMCQVRGRPVFYPGNGRLRLQGLEFSPAGDGVLLARVEELKRRLSEEGIFDEERKRPLPVLPGRIGLVTGPDAAARGDVVRTVEERYPGMAISFAPCVVQGPQCPGQVARAIARLDRDPRVSVIVVTRGGGSLEDLMGFNSEEVVRAIATCQTPVVAAIGHERDVSLAELAADVRAATPTGAAVCACPERAELSGRLEELSGRARDSATRRLARLAESLAALVSRPCLSGTTGVLELRRGEIAELCRRAQAAYDVRLTAARSLVEREAERAGMQMAMFLRTRAQALGELSAMVSSALNPEAPLRRGHALVTDADGALVTSAQVARTAQGLVLRFADGAVSVRPVDAG